MYVSELIKELEKIREDHGEDVMLVVRYRETGGEFSDSDSDLRLE